MEKLTYRGQEVKEIKNACGGGHNQLDSETVRYLQRTFQDKYKQIFVRKDGTEVVGTIGDITVK